MNYSRLAKLYLLPVLGLLALSTVFFLPQLQNKVTNSSDIRSFKAMSHEIMEHKEKTGELSGWSNSMFGGFPTYQIVSAQPSNLLTHVNKALQLYIPRPIGLFFLVMLCAYISLLMFGASSWVSFFGAAVIGLSASNFLLFHAGHMTKFRVIGYCIPIFMGVYLAYKKNWLHGAALYGLSLGLALLANHPQMLYYMGFSLVTLFILMLVDVLRGGGEMGQFLKTTGALAVITILALATSASKIMPTLEYAKDTMRGAPLLKSTAQADSKSSEVEGLDWQYATNWSNGTMDVITGFIPGAAGGGSQETAPSGSQTVENLKKKGARVSSDMKLPLYWGSMGSTGGVFYFGAVLFFLVFLQFFAGNKQLSIWLGISLVLMIMISMGRNMEWFNRILFDYFPMFNKFRTPNSISSVMAAIIGLGATFGLHSATTKSWGKKEFTRAIIFAASPLLLFSLFFALLGPGFFDFQGGSDAAYAQRGFDTADLIADRKIMMSKDAWRSFIFVLLASALTYLYALEKIKKPVLIIGLTALAVFDLTGIGKRYLSQDEFQPKRKTERQFAKRPVDEQILNVEKSRGAYRVLDQSINTFNDASTSYWHNTIGGYHPAKLQRFEDIKNNHLYTGNQAVINMLNTKYFISKDQKLQQNGQALGNCWFVNKVQMVQTNDEEIQALNGFNPSATAIVHNDFASVVNSLNLTGNGSIQMTSYAPNKIVYSSNTASEELAIFSEVWYGPDKGWNVTIDGKPASMIRANYILRGLVVPAGTHEIVFEFKPTSVKTGNLITLISSILLIALVGFLIFKQIKSSQNAEETSAPETKPRKKKSRKK